MERSGQEVYGSHFMYSAFFTTYKETGTKEEAFVKPESQRLKEAGKKALRKHGPTRG